jgi:hypothetical protein
MFLSTRQVAERYGVTIDQVQRWIASGDLVAIVANRKLGMKKPRYRISLAALEAFEALRSAAPAPKKRRRKVATKDVAFY